MTTIADWDLVICEHCKRQGVATTERGFKRHQTLCKENPANVGVAKPGRRRSGVDLRERIQTQANAKLISVRDHLQEIERMNVAQKGVEDEQALQRHVQAALGDFRSYYELIELFETP